jgi:predicted enzyme related to lactoylglutathione lyase
MRERERSATRRETMSAVSNDRRIDYIELPATDLERVKAFYTQVFGWTFTDYGDDYIAFEDGRLTGGFYRASGVTAGGPLIVVYARDLASVQQAIEGAGGQVVRPVFAFPGGRRFHFSDPSGNVLAVWSE